MTDRKKRFEVDTHTSKSEINSFRKEKASKTILILIISMFIGLIISIPLTHLFSFGIEINFFGNVINADIMIFFFIVTIFTYALLKIIQHSNKRKNRIRRERIRTMK